jgi:hypothetical protein
MAWTSSRRPATTAAGSDGFTTCAACVPGTLTTNAGEMTITITGLVLAPSGSGARLPSSIAVTYSAALPVSVADDTFTAMTQTATADVQRSRLRAARVVVASRCGAMSAIAVKAVRARCWAMVLTAASWSCALKASTSAS